MLAKTCEFVPMLYVVHILIQQYRPPKYFLISMDPMLRIYSLLLINCQITLITYFTLNRWVINLIINLPELPVISRVSWSVTAVTSHASPSTSPELVLCVVSARDDRLRHNFTLQFHRLPKRQIRRPHYQLLIKHL